MTGHSSDTLVFSRRFGRWAWRVRWRLGARHVLSGIGFGLMAGAVAAALLWHYRLPELRPWTVTFAFVGALGGLLVSLRQRWSDVDVGLFLDARLDTEETISTAVDLQRRQDGSHRARTVVMRRASAALAEAQPSRARPRILRRLHLLGPVGVMALAWLGTLAPKPPPVPARPQPGTELVRIPDLAELERITALEKLDARDAEQRKRLQQIAARARQLRADLARGIAKREAQARIAKLRDEIAAERLHFADRHSRPGLDAAVRRLEQDFRMRRAARALGNGDLTKFDDEMRRLANQAEQNDRAAAKEALKEAAKLARERGAGQLGEALDEQRRLFGERAASAQALRELATQLRGKLDEQALQDLEEFGETGSAEAQQRLAEALEEALQALSEAERARLAEQLKRQLEREDVMPEPLTRQQLEQLAEQLQTEAGKKQLAESLRQLANPKPSPEAQRERGLEDAERGGAACQRRLGVIPVPVPRQSRDSSGSNQNRPGAADPNRTHGTQGGGQASRDQHQGETERVSGDELRAKARSRFHPNAPLHGTSLGRAPARPGETANQVGQRALGQARPAEVSGVERSDVPKDYQEQVGRYFQP